MISLHVQNVEISDLIGPSKPVLSTVLLHFVFPFFKGAGRVEERSGREPP